MCIHQYALPGTGAREFSYGPRRVGRSGVKRRGTGTQHPWSIFFVRSGDGSREHQAERIVALPDADSSLIMPNDIVDLPARIISKLRGFDGVGNR